MTGRAYTTVEFRVYGVPAPTPRLRHRIVQRRDRAAFVHAYTPTLADKWKRAVRAAASLAMGGHEPFSGPVAVERVFLFPRTDEQMRPSAPPGRVWCPQHVGDEDNLVKAVNDALNGVVYEDDRQICDGRVLKCRCARGEAPGVIVRVYRLAGASTPTLFEEVSER